jgi:uroporphyrinogen III methyltransferase/synthase
MTAQSLGKVFLVGAGPGDPELLTLKGKRCLEAADVIFFDELANRELLGFASRSVQLIYVGKKPGQHYADQRDIEALLIEHARRGLFVVRLKGGDPFVFGRGGEEALALQAAGIPFEIVPGVSAAIAVPAYAGIPVTHRGSAASFAVLTGHRVADAAINWSGLLQSIDTLVILMGLANLPMIMNRLLENGCDPARPVALIQSGTRKNQRVISGTVGAIAARATHENLKSPLTIVVGAVADLANQLNWFDGPMPGLITNCGVASEACEFRLDGHTDAT